MLRASLVCLLLVACRGSSPDVTGERQTKKIDASGQSGGEDGEDEQSGESAQTGAPTSSDPETDDPVTIDPEAPPDTVSWGEVDSYGPTRRYRLFIPGTLAGPAPLVVMLHGCDEDAADFAAVTGMDAIAKREGFVVVYPEQPAAANPLRCWNWFDVTEQARSGTEARFVLAVVAEAQTQATIDASRIFVAGLSAGAAMAVILGSCFPEHFRAVASHSGTAFKAANNAFTAPGIMAGGPMYSGDLSADGSRLCSGGNHVTAAFALTGTADSTVNPAHSTRIYDQFRALGDWADDDARNESLAADVSSTGIDARTYLRTETTLADGRTITRVDVNGLGHAWSGGAAGFKYSDPTGPSASELFWAFFAAQP